MTDVLASPTPTALPNDRAPGPASDDDLTPIDRYLREQQELTAVERFSQRHDADLVPAQSRYYRDLIPLARPAAGQQYAFEVDLDSCSGCKACVTACHRLNGLDDGEAFRTVGTLIATVPVEDERWAPVDLRTSAPTARRAATEAPVVQPWQQTVTTACHHCVEPACLAGCPVDAYDKDPVTGIVKHLDDQCIGCSYCTLTCPYEVPTFNHERGIVRKCDLCSDRLAEGEAPACVQACPTSAISVTIVDVAELVAATAAATLVDAEHALVPAAPPSRLTTPTTRYRSSAPLPAAALPADHFAVVPGHAHPPLTVMLVLTQLAVGAFVVDLAVRRFGGAALADLVRSVDAFAALAVGLLALGASTMHLGRPLYAWRAVIGLRHSWLSREIVAFGGFAGAAAAYATSLWIGAPASVSRVLAVVTAVLGVVGVLCSALIYAVTGRRWWRVVNVVPKFAATAVVTGTSLVLALASAAALGRDDAPALLAALEPLPFVVMAVTLVQLGAQATIFGHQLDRDVSELRRTAMLLAGDLSRVTVARFVCGILGGGVLAIVVFANLASPEPNALAALLVSTAMVVLTVAGELAERWLFFTASSAPRMPGGLR